MRRRLCPKEALFTPSFIAVCSANLLFFIASFMMVPVLPIYLLDGLHASKSVVGIILSAYMIGALVMRPLSGFLADQFPRKILFLVCGILFAAQFEGYLLFNALALVGIVRALHGMSFGALSTSAATLDVIPIAKLGTGIGLYGMMGSLAMALGPMIGMLVLEAGSYDAVFITAMGCAAGGILLGLLTAVLYGCIVLSNKQLRDISAYDRTLVQLGITTLVLIPYCILHGDFVGLQITGGQLALLLILGVVHTGFAYSLYFGSMAYLPAQTLAILSYLDPVTAVLLSALVLHDPLSGFEILGAVCILGAAVVSELPGRVKKM